MFIVPISRYIHTFYFDENFDGKNAFQLCQYVCSSMSAVEVERTLRTFDVRTYVLNILVYKTTFHSSNIIIKKFLELE